MKLLLSVLSVTCLLSVSTLPGQAKASMATDIGVKITEKVVSAVLGEAASKAMAAIFGTGPDPLTLAQVEGAIKNAFAQAALKDIRGDRNGLMNQVNIYSGEVTATRTATAILGDIGRLLVASGNIDGDIAEQITPENSMTTIPVFISVWNTRLAFLGERYRISQSAGDKALIAEETVKGMEKLEKYLEQKYVDPKRKNFHCVQKDRNFVWRYHGVDASDWSEKGHDVTTQYCFGNGWVVRKDAFGNKPVTQKMAQVAKFNRKLLVDMGASHFMRTTDLGQDGPDPPYTFARRMDKNASKYFLEASPSKGFAKMLRNHYIVKYNTGRFELGKLHEQILGWVNLAKATGSKGQYLVAAGYAMNLGIGWNILKSKYGDSEIGNHIQRMRETFARRKEYREIND